MTIIQYLNMINDILFQKNLYNSSLSNRFAFGSPRYDIKCGIMQNNDLYCVKKYLLHSNGVGTFASLAKTLT